MVFRSEISSSKRRRTIKSRRRPLDKGANNARKAETTTKTIEQSEEAIGKRRRVEERKRWDVSDDDGDEEEEDEEDEEAPLFSFSSSFTCVICITSPFTKCSKTRLNSSITSTFRKLAKVTDALASKNSPAKLANLFPTSKFNARKPLLVAEPSKTSSCNKLAT